MIAHPGHAKRVAAHLVQGSRRTGFRVLGAHQVGVQGSRVLGFRVLGAHLVKGSRVLGFRSTPARVPRVQGIGFRVLGAPLVDGRGPGVQGSRGPGFRGFGSAPGQAPGPAHAGCPVRPVGPAPRPGSGPSPGSAAAAASVIPGAVAKTHESPGSGSHSTCPSSRCTGCQDLGD